MELSGPPNENKRHVDVCSQVRERATARVRDSTHNTTCARGTTCLSLVPVVVAVVVVVVVAAWASESPLPQQLCGWMNKKRRRTVAHLLLTGSLNRITQPNHSTESLNRITQPNHSTESLSLPSSDDEDEESSALGAAEAGSFTGGFTRARIDPTAPSLDPMDWPRDSDFSGPVT
eukprot:GHVU01111770.1.p1 GENE.GHVU01111770.1~~GHVU01111770.1.p1  ORF type:complete len:175 (+),score=11.04 GHVU01111770.1:1009-1533(+)